LRVVLRAPSKVLLSICPLVVAWCDARSAIRVRLQIAQAITVFRNQVGRHRPRRAGGPLLAGATTDAAQCAARF